MPAAPLDGGRVLRAALRLDWRPGPRGCLRGPSRPGLRLPAGRTGPAAGAAHRDLERDLARPGRLVPGERGDRRGAAGANDQQVVRPAGQRRDDQRPVVADESMRLNVFVDRVAMTHMFSSYPLADRQGRLTGLVTLNRVRAVPGGRCPATTLRDVACPSEEVPTTRPEEPLTALLPRLRGCTDGRAVVLDQRGAVIGIISSTDISRAMQLADPRSMEAYPPPRGADLTTADKER
ncbi:MAG: CBS domain-containing protein [Nocardioidaceae bacterium]